MFQIYVLNFSIRFYTHIELYSRKDVAFAIGVLGGLVLLKFPKKW